MLRVNSTRGWITRDRVSRRKYRIVVAVGTCVHTWFIFIVAWQTIVAHVRRPPFYRKGGGEKIRPWPNPTEPVPTPSSPKRSTSVFDHCWKKLRRGMKILPFLDLQGFDAIPEVTPRIRGATENFLAWRWVLTGRHRTQPIFYTTMRTSSERVAWDRLRRVLRSSAELPLMFGGRRRCSSKHFLNSIPCTGIELLIKGCRIICQAINWRGEREMTGVCERERRGEINS